MQDIKVYLQFNISQEADLNKNGLIDWEEFVEMMLPGQRIINRDQ